MSLEKVAAAVANNRSLWVELECPDVIVPLPISAVQPVVDPRHCTILFLGKGFVFGDRLLDVCRSLARQSSPFSSRVSGVARFRGNEREGDPVVLLLSAPVIRGMAQYLEIHLDRGGVKDWDYTPHVTLGRIPRDKQLALDVCPISKIDFKSIAICAGEDRLSLDLTGGSK